VTASAGFHQPIKCKRGLTNESAKRSIDDNDQGSALAKLDDKRGKRVERSGDRGALLRRAKALLPIAVRTSELSCARRPAAPESNGKSRGSTWGIRTLRSQ
jgi:hypothetical protein